MFTNEPDILKIGSLATNRGSVVRINTNLEWFMYYYPNTYFPVYNITNLRLLMQYFSLEILVTLFGTDSLSTTQDHSELDGLLYPLR